MRFIKILNLFFLSYYIFGYSNYLKSINKEIESAIVKSESHKLFNLVSSIVVVNSKDKDYYIKLAHEESTKALMHFDSYRFKRTQRVTIGLISFLAIGFTVLNSWDLDGNDKTEAFFIRLIKGGCIVTGALGIREIYRSATGFDLKNKINRALAVEALVNRLQVDNSDI